LIRTQPVIKQLANNILFTLGKINYCSNETLTKINRSIEAAVKSEFFNDYVVKNNINL